MSLGDGGTASCKLGKAQVGSGVVGGGCLTWVGSRWERLHCSASALNKLHSTCSSAAAMASCYSSNEFRCVQGGVRVHTLLVWRKEQTDSLLVVCWVWLTTVHHSSIPWVSAVLRVDPSFEGAFFALNKRTLKSFCPSPHLTSLCFLITTSNMMRLLCTEVRTCSFGPTPMVQRDQAGFRRVLRVRTQI